MYKHMKEHEKYIRSCLDSKEDRDWQALLGYHQVQIRFMQHERLVHLAITVAFAFFLLAFFLAAMALESLWFLAISVILIVVESFYILHYYRLENGIQRWYKLYEEIYNRL